MPSCPDVPIIGSGVGGGTLAYRLVQHGLTVTILERGGFLPTEPPDIPHIHTRLSSAARRPGVWLIPPAW